MEVSQWLLEQWAVPSERGRGGWLWLVVKQWAVPSEGGRGVCFANRCCTEFSNRNRLRLLPYPELDMAATGVLPFIRGVDLSGNDFKVSPLF